MISASLAPSSENGAFSAAKPIAATPQSCAFSFVWLSGYRSVRSRSASVGARSSVAQIMRRSHRRLDRIDAYTQASAPETTNTIVLTRISRSLWCRCAGSGSTKFANTNTTSAPAAFDAIIAAVMRRATWSASSLAMA